MVTHSKLSLHKQCICLLGEHTVDIVLGGCRSGHCGIILQGWRILSRTPIIKLAVDIVVTAPALINTFQV